MCVFRYDTDRDGSLCLTELKQACDDFLATRKSTSNYMKRGASRPLNLQEVFKATAETSSNPTPRTGGVSAPPPPPCLPPNACRLTVEVEEAKWVAREKQVHQRASELQACGLQQQVESPYTVRYLLESEENDQQESPLTAHDHAHDLESALSSLESPSVWNCSAYPRP